MPVVTDINVNLIHSINNIKSNSFCGHEPPKVNLQPQFAMELSITCSNATETAQLAAPSWSRPQLTQDNGIETVDPID